jgi:hypothetical protein
LLGVFYGGVVALGIAVWRYARYTRNEGILHTGDDQSHMLRVWCILLIVITTVVMWVWPFQYVSYLWFLINHSLLWTPIFLIGAILKPLAALVTAVLGVRLYEGERSAVVIGKSTTTTG